MRLKKFIPVLTLLMFYGCIGTDIVEEVLVPADLAISRTADSIQIGNTFAFEADYFNEFGQMEAVEINWSSTDPTIISINDTGEGTALDVGSSFIKAAYMNVVDSILVSVATVVNSELSIREGIFKGNRDYEVNGTFTLAEMGNDLELSFDSDFTASNGPGLFVYLSNSQENVTGGVEVGQLQSNSGAQSYTISMSDAQLGTYRFVLIYCKPFGIPFGIGTFNN